jgi:hypothetical protein
VHCADHPVPYPGCASCVPVTPPPYSTGRFPEDEMERSRR